MSAEPLNYAGRMPRRSRWLVPRWFAVPSVLPVAAFVAILYLDHRSRFWQFLQLKFNWDREHTQGMLWILTAGFSLACLIVLMIGRKRRDAWVALALHSVFIALTICPGSIAIQ